MDRGGPHLLQLGTTSIGPLPEPRDDVGVRRAADAVGDVGALGVGPEQHPVQTGVGRVLGGRPVQHEARLRTGQGDVQQPQRLPGPLACGDADVLLVRGSATADVEAPTAFGVQPQDVALGVVAVEQERRMDHRVLQALAHERRDHLHGLGVGVETTGPLGGPSPVGASVEQPAQEPRAAERLRPGGLLEDVPDVLEVGEQPSSALVAEHAGDDVGVGDDGLDQPGGAAGAVEVGEVAQPGGHRVGEAVPGDAVELLGPVAEERADRDGTHEAGAVRGLQCAEQRQPVLGGFAAQDVGSTTADGGDPGSGELGVDELGLRVPFDEDGDVARTHRARSVSVVEGGGPGEEPGDVGGDVAGDGGARCRDPHQGVVRDAGVVAQHGPQTERVGPVGIDQARSVEGGAGGAHHDLLVPEGGPAQQDVDGLHERGVAAVVQHQRATCAGSGGSVQVGGDVAAAEAVDGLLGIADEHHRGVPDEGPLEDLPLDGIGVLELVDQHDAPPVAHQGPRRGVGCLERLGEPLQEVVVGQGAQAATPSAHLVADGAGEAASQVGRGVGRGVDRQQRGRRVADGAHPDLASLLGLERQGPAARGVAQVEVGDRLGDEVGVVLDERRARLDVAGGAEAAQDGVAEPVRGGDGGLVEAGRGDAQPVATPAALVGVGVQHEGEELVVRRGRRGGLVAAQGVVEGAFGLHEPLAHAVLELGTGRPTERDDEEVVDRREPLGEVARDERGDGPRLAGACARLEQGGALGQGVADAELGGLRRRGFVLGVAHVASRCSSSGVHSLSAWRSSPRRRRSSTEQSPSASRW